MRPVRTAAEEDAIARDHESNRVAWNLPGPRELGASLGSSQMSDEGSGEAMDSTEGTGEHE